MTHCCSCLPRSLQPDRPAIPKSLHTYLFLHAAFRIIDEISLPINMVDDLQVCPQALIHFLPVFWLLSDGIALDVDLRQSGPFQVSDPPEVLDQIGIYGEVVEAGEFGQRLQVLALKATSDDSYLLLLSYSWVRAGRVGKWMRELSWQEQRDRYQILWHFQSRADICWVRRTSLISSRHSSSILRGAPCYLILCTTFCKEVGSIDLQYTGKAPILNACLQPVYQMTKEYKYEWSVVTLVAVLVGAKQLLYLLGVEDAVHRLSLIVEHPLQVVVVLPAAHGVVQILLEGRLAVSVVLVLGVHVTLQLLQPKIALPDGLPLELGLAHLEIVDYLLQLLPLLLFVAELGRQLLDLAQHFKQALFHLRLLLLALADLLVLVVILQFQLLYLHVRLLQLGHYLEVIVFARVYLHSLAQLLDALIFGLVVFRHLSQFLKVVGEIAQEGLLAVLRLVLKRVDHDLFGLAGIKRILRCRRPFLQRYACILRSDLLLQKGIIRRVLSLAESFSFLSGVVLPLSLQ